MMVSDLESDLEPDELLSTYLSTKLRLYEARPDLVMTNTRKTAKKATLANRGLKESSGIRKLQSKLQKIESDVLFDQRDAEDRWIDKRNELAQELAERRKLQLPPRQTEQKRSMAYVQEESKKPQMISESSSDSSSSEDDDEDDDIALGDLFGAIPSDAQKEPHAQVLEGRDADAALAIRDFGAVQGLTPLRILEEACRAR